MHDPLNLYEGNSFSKTYIITQAAGLTNDLVAEEQNANSRQPADLPTEVWCLPPDSFFSVTADAGFGENGNRACGALIRDCSGCIVQASSIILPSGIDILHGELLAILRGMELAQHHGLRNIMVWSDCLGAVNLVDNSDEPLHPLAALIHDCWQKTYEFENCFICFTRREHNRPAHLLAIWGLLHSMSMDWGSNPPPHVIEAAFADLQ